MAAPLSVLPSAPLAYPDPDPAAALARLQGFRARLHACRTRRADALVDLADPAEPDRIAARALSVPFIWEGDPDADLPVDGWDGVILTPSMATPCTSNRPCGSSPAHLSPSPRGRPG